MAFRQAFRWRGGDGGWETLASWDDGSNYPGDSVSSERDDVLFDGVSSVDVTGDLDQSGAVPIRRFVTYESSVNNIGSSGNFLNIPIDSGNDPNSLVDHQGSGVFYLQATSGNFCNVFLRSGRPRGSGAAMVATGTLNHVFVERGRLDITTDASCNIAKSLEVCGSGAEVRIASGVILSHTIIVQDGTVYCNADILPSTAQVIIVAGRGTWYQYGSVADSVRVITLGGGKFVYEPQSALTSSHNPNVYAFGVLDMVDSIYDVEFNTLIIGSNASVMGSAIQVAGQPSPLAAYIDGRQEYP